MRKLGRIAARAVIDSRLGGTVRGPPAVAARAGCPLLGNCHREVSLVETRADDFSCPDRGWGRRALICRLAQILQLGPESRVLSELSV